MDQEDEEDATNKPITRERLKEHDDRQVLPPKPEVSNEETGNEDALNDEVFSSGSENSASVATNTTMRKNSLNSALVGRECGGTGNGSLPGNGYQGSGNGSVPYGKLANRAPNELI